VCFEEVIRRSGGKKLEVVEEVVRTGGRMEGWEEVK